VSFSRDVKLVLRPEKDEGELIEQNPALFDAVILRKSQVAPYRPATAWRASLSNGTEKTIKYCHENNGNLTKREDSTGTANFTTDKLNRLTKEELPSGAMNSYEYDEASNLSDQSGQNAIASRVVAIGSCGAVVGTGAGRLSLPERCVPARHGTFSKKQKKNGSSAEMPEVTARRKYLLAACAVLMIVGGVIGLTSGGRSAVALAIYISAPVLGVVIFYQAFRKTS